VGADSRRRLPLVRRAHDVPGVARRPGGLRLVTGFRPSPEQALVIASPLDSLRVSAGAGTGKTATVAARVAALVRDHGVPPDAVIGLTFTNKAAEELAERIHRHLGGAPDRAVEVLTYHGFAAAILRELGVFVGVDRDARLLTPAYARQLVTVVLAAGTFDAFDPSSAGAVDAVLRLAGETGEHLLDPDRVPPGSGAAAAARTEILAAVAAYTAEKRRLGMVDYGDLVSRAWQLVTTRPEAAETLRGRYRAVVLDEYQDTSPAQRELLRALFSGRVPVMAVGDADQTIYEWRGASAENFEDFPAHFPAADGPAPTRVLSLNRRSGAAVLAVGNAVRARIDDRPRPALSPLPAAPRGRVVAHWDGTATEEADRIAATAERLHGEGRRWRDMAVLFRKNKDMTLVHEALARRDIPFEVANLGGLLSVPEVVDVVSWLRIVHDPYDGPALVRLLLGSRFRLGLGDLATLVRGAGGDEGDDPGSLVEALDGLDGLALRPPAALALARFRTEHRLLLERAQASTVSDLTRSILDVTGAWSDVEAMEPPAALTARLNLYRFLDLTEEWSPLDGRPSLGAFLDHLRVLEEDHADAPDAARLSGEDAVVLLTVHRAKGLEWPIVFLPALYEGNFPAHGGVPDPRTAAAALPFELRLDRDALPDPDLDDRAWKAALAERGRRQEWRTAYVATTRPREELYVSGAWWYGNPEPRKTPARPSELFTLVAGLADDAGEVSAPPPRPGRLLVASSPAPDPLFPASWAGGVRAALADPSWADRTAARRRRRSLPGRKPRSASSSRTRRAPSATSGRRSTACRAARRRRRGGGSTCTGASSCTGRASCRCSTRTGNRRPGPAGRPTAPTHSPSTSPRGSPPSGRRSSRSPSSSRSVRSRCGAGSTPSTGTPTTGRSSISSRDDRRPTRPGPSSSRCTPSPPPTAPSGRRPGPSPRRSRTSGAGSSSSRPRRPTGSGSPPPGGGSTGSSPGSPEAAGTPAPPPPAGTATSSASAPRGRRSHDPAVPGLEQEGDGAVVDEGHGHHRPEDAGGDGQTGRPEPVDDRPDEGLRLSGRGGGGERGPPPPTRVAVEGELAHDEDPSPDVPDRPVHEPVVVGEDAEGGDLGGDRRRVLAAVPARDPDEDEESPTDLADDLAGDLAVPRPAGTGNGDARRRNPLDDGPHRTSPAGLTG